MWRRWEPATSGGFGVVNDMQINRGALGGSVIRTIKISITRVTGSVLGVSILTVQGASANTYEIR